MSIPDDILAEHSAAPSRLPLERDGSVGGNEWLAFLVSVGAGMATSIGAAMVFFTRFYSKKFLAIGLAIAAGVMIYVSMIEIFFKSVDYYAAARSRLGSNNLLFTEQQAFSLATGTFFSGIIVTVVLDVIVHRLYGCVGMKAHNHMLPESAFRADETCRGKVVQGTGTQSASGKSTKHAQRSASWRSRRRHDTDGHRVSEHSDEDLSSSNDSTRASRSDEQRRRSKQNLDEKSSSGSDTGEENGTQVPGSPVDSEQGRQKLMRTALITAVAVTIHNFPEGLATFIGLIDNFGAGVPLAIAIAIHNIPEGICVAVPILFSTKSKWKGFWAGVFSGISEPLGAMTGWLILGGSDADPMVYAVMFGIVGGMMTYISFKELLPTALKYDPRDRYVTTFCFAGMAVMALSLVIFRLYE